MDIVHWTGYHGAASQSYVKTPIRLARRHETQKEIRMFFEISLSLSFRETDFFFERKQQKMASPRSQKTHGEADFRTSPCFDNEKLDYAFLTA